MPRISDEIKMEISVLRRQGMSWAKICKETKVSRSTARSIIKKERKTGSIQNKKSPGRPPKLNARDVRQLKKIVRCGRRQSLSSVTKEFNKCKPIKSQVCKKTVRKYLKAHQWVQRAAAKVPLINRTNRLRRLNFCKKMKSFNWNDVVFSDECRFALQSDGRSLVWRNPGQRFHPECVIPRSNFPKSLMFWGCIDKNGVGLLIECSNKMNSEEYLSVLNTASIQLLPQFGLTFQQDNAPIHKTKSIMSFFVDNNIQTLEWPSNSPDLNIIENIWAIIKQKINKKNPPLSSIAQLRNFVNQSWSEIEKMTVKRLYSSIPGRLEACIKSKGYATRF